MLQQFVQYARQIVVNLVVPEPQNKVTSALKPIISLLIPCSIKSMLSAVKFDDQFALKTDKVSNIGSHRMLSAKAISTELFPPQRLPKHPFSFGLIAT